MSALRTEADLLRTLESGTYPVAELYRRVVAAGLADRDRGRERVQDGQERYKRRVRTVLQRLKAAGRAHRVENGEAAWFIEGTYAVPRRALFVWLPVDPSQVELVLGRAADVLARADEPMSLIVADPPWALARADQGAAYQRTYARNGANVMPGYVEVDPAEYADFTVEWMLAAAGALQPGGYLAVVTGAQQSARVQVIGEDVAGLTYVNSISVRRTMGMYCTRRYVHGHNRVTLLTKGPLGSAARVFTRPPEMPRGEAGEVYAVDVWDDIPDERRPGLLRYDNALHPRLVSRVVRSTTRRGDLVADPFVGSGTTPYVCLQTGRRFYGGDANPHALRFTMGRILAELVPTMQPGQLALVDPMG